MNQQQRNRLYQVLGERLREYRTAKGLTQEQLASKIELTRTSVVNIEQGRQHPPLHLLFQISEALEVDLYNFIPKPADFNTNPLLNPEILKGISEADASKVTHFVEKFQKKTR